MPNFYEALDPDNLSPFDSAAMMAIRLTTMLIMDKACVEAFELERDISCGLNDLELPDDVRIHVLCEYVRLKDRWNLLLASPFCVD